MINFVSLIFLICGFGSLANAAESNLAGVLDCPFDFNNRFNIEVIPNSSTIEAGDVFLATLNITPVDGRAWDGLDKVFLVNTYCEANAPEGVFCPETSVQLLKDVSQYAIQIKTTKAMLGHYSYQPHYSVYQKPEGTYCQQHLHNRPESFAVENQSNKVNMKAPVIKQVSSDKLRYQPGQPMTLTFEVSDKNDLCLVPNEFCGASDFIILNTNPKAAFELGQAVQLEKKSDGIYELRYQILDDAPEGEYSLDYLVLYDEVGNWTRKPQDLSLKIHVQP